MTTFDGTSRSTYDGWTEPPRPAPIYELVTDVGPGLPPVLVKKKGIKSSTQDTQSILAGWISRRPKVVGLRTIPQTFDMKKLSSYPPGLLPAIRPYPWEEPIPVKIRTKLPHPLTILDDTLGPDSKPCHWCDNFAYGIAGFGVRYPVVVEKSKGKWTELKGGHTAEGREPSRMCVRCTCNRLSIIHCSHDKIVSLAEDPNVELDENPILDQMEKASQAVKCKPGSICKANQSFQEPLHPWCSLCQSPAYWRCDNHQPDARDPDSRDFIPLDTGCGLHLCDYCAEYTKRFRGDLDDVYEHGVMDTDNDTAFRADVDYILKRSEENVFFQQINHNKKM